MGRRPSAEQPPCGKKFFCSSHLASPRAEFFLTTNIFLFGMGLKTAAPLLTLSRARYLGHAGFPPRRIHLAACRAGARGLLPAGWMPNPRPGETTLAAVCPPSEDGPVQSTDGGKAGQRRSTRVSSPFRARRRTANRIRRSRCAGTVLRRRRALPRLKTFSSATHFEHGRPRAPPTLT